MNKILVTEFINQKSLDRLNKVFEVYYDEKLWRNSKKISKLIRDFDCLILRNKTIVKVTAEIVKKQVLSWELDEIEKLIIHINNIEVLIKKNSNNAINIIYDFILNTGKKISN